MTKGTSKQSLELHRCRQALKRLGASRPTASVGSSVLRLGATVRTWKFLMRVDYQVRLLVPLPDRRVKSSKGSTTIALTRVADWLEAAAAVAEAGLLSPRDLLLAWIVRQGGPAEGACVAESLDGNDCLVVAKRRRP